VPSGENKRTAKISTFGIAILSMLYGYSRQRRAIGFFLAIAGLLVNTSADAACVS